MTVFPRFVARVPCRTVLVGLCLALLAACTTMRGSAEWPERLPPREYYLEQWRADAANAALQEPEEYLLWVRRFYFGFNMIPGWLDMVERVKARLEPADSERLDAELAGLGRTISAEWAKNNEVRLIDTRCAAVWRDALVEALAQDDLWPYIDRLRADVDALLAGELDKEAIRFERYYVDEFEF